MNLSPLKLPVAVLAIVVAMFLFLPYALVIAEDTGEQSQEGTPAEESTSEEPVEEEAVPEEEPLDDTDGSQGGEDETDGGGVVIVTGDAEAGGDVQNEANTNEVETNPEPDTEETGDTETQPEGEVLEETSQGGGGGGNGPDVDAEVNLENEAVASTTMNVDAGTGENVASTTDGTALILTGDAFAHANVINVINSNIVNSYGFLLLLNLLFGQGIFDLRDLDFPDFSHTPTESTCSFSGCDGADLTVNATSTATISNDVVVRASTGDNTANGGGGAYIGTGDAYAGANVINLANTNIVDSNYLLIGINNFGDLNSDIVFPGASFFEQFLGGFNLFGGTDIAVSNQAEVNNNLDVGAETGGNTAHAADGGDAVIATGDAVSGSNVINTVNTNLLGGSSFYLLLQVHGSWSGEIFGLPDGISWAQTEDGIVLFSDPDGDGTAGEGGNSVNLNATNQALVNNNISVFALTGENEANGGDAMIGTGNAYAGANVFNLVNTNIVGRNWIMAALNIFGDWNGNLAFGRPDLWIGGRAEAPSPSQMSKGSPITYHFTVSNLGDSPATNIILKNESLNSLVNLPEGLSIPIGTLKPGESEEVTVTGNMAIDPPQGDTPLTLLSSVVSRETDNNPDDNTEELTIMASNHAPEAKSNRSTSMAKLTVEKSASASTVAPGNSVDYTIVVKNHGGAAFNALLVDTLKNAAGEAIATQTWDLGKIYSGEEITVTYTMTFEAGTDPGMYTNEAQVLAKNTSSGNGKNRSGSANSPSASTQVLVLGGEVGLCEKYLFEYIRLGANNDPDEVTKLQLFLRNYEDVGSVEVTGVYDEATVSAVRAFQEKYADEVLTPWGLSGSTGYVYYTTQRKINELYCRGEIAFDLTGEQRAEIERFRELIERRQEEGLPLPDTSEVGVLPINDPAVARKGEEDGVGGEEGGVSPITPEALMATPPQHAIPGVSSLIKQNFGLKLLDLLNAFGDVKSWILKSDPKNHQSSR
jgi:uncharacterized repeat protein (TIGR01451 family)